MVWKMLKDGGIIPGLMRADEPCCVLETLSTVDLYEEMPTFCTKPLLDPYVHERSRVNGQTLDSEGVFRFCVEDPSNYR